MMPLLHHRQRSLAVTFFCVCAISPLSHPTGSAAFSSSTVLPRTLAQNHLSRLLLRSPAKFSSPRDVRLVGLMHLQRSANNNLQLTTSSRVKRRVVGIVRKVYTAVCAAVVALMALIAFPAHAMHNPTIQPVPGRWREGLGHETDAPSVVQFVDKKDRSLRVAGPLQVCTSTDCMLVARSYTSGVDPFFPHLNSRWASIPPYGEIPSTVFMTAVEDFVPIFDRLGRAFFPVKADVSGNVEKLRRALQANPTETVQELIRREKAKGNQLNSDGACEALLWLKRAIQFMSVLLAKVDSGAEFSHAAREAYESTLMRFHGFIEQRAFQVTLRAAPATTTMLHSLGPDADEVLSDMRVFVRLSQKQMANIDAFLREEGLETT